MHSISEKISLEGKTQHVFCIDKPVAESDKKVITVFQKKWRQNSNHYNYGTPYQN